MPWNPDDVIGCLFIFRIHLPSMKNLCVSKRKFTHGVGKLASLGNLPSRKQSLRKPLPLCKIACVSTGNADTPPTVMHHSSTSTWLASSIISVLFHFCIVENMLLQAKRLVIIPQYAFLGHLRINVRVNYTINTYPFFYVIKDLCWIKLCGLQDLRPAVSQRLL